MTELQIKILYDNISEVVSNAINSGVSLHVTHQILESIDRDVKALLIQKLKEEMASQAQPANEDGES